MESMAEDCRLNFAEFVGLTGCRTAMYDHTDMSKCMAVPWSIIGIRCITTKWLARVVRCCAQICEPGMGNRNMYTHLAWVIEPCI